MYQVTQLLWIHRKLVSHYSLDNDNRKQTYIYHENLKENSSTKRIFDIRWCAQENQRDLGCVLRTGLSCVLMYSACPSIKSSTCLGDIAHHLFICSETGVWIDLYFSHVLKVRIVKSNLEPKYILFLGEKLYFTGLWSLAAQIYFWRMT